jgi:pimeloyl-ACP methyl ester carboxylesterase
MQGQSLTSIVIGLVAFASIMEAQDGTPPPLSPPGQLVDVGAGERPPYLLVGHLYGGWLVRTYASAYPSEVGGIVLVEGGADNPWRMMPGRKPW